MSAQPPASRRAICARPRPRASSAFPSRTLEKHRTYGTGPRYSKLGGRVVYRLEDLQAWVELGVKASTSDPGVGRCCPPSAIPPSRRPMPVSRAADRPAPPCRRDIAHDRNASSSNCFARSPAIWRRATRRTSWPILSSASPRPTARRRSISAMGDIAIRVEAVPEHGMATIWDADVLIWAATQIVEARDAGLRTSRLMAATPYEILTFIGRGTSAARLSAPEGGARPAAVDDGRDIAPPDRPSGGCTASPGSTNGPSAPTRTAIPAASN